MTAFTSVSQPNVVSSMLCEPLFFRLRKRANEGGDQGQLDEGTKLRVAPRQRTSASASSNVGDFRQSNNPDNVHTVLASSSISYSDPII